MEEIWKDIPDTFWKYQSSNTWLIRSFRNWKYLVLRNTISNWYYVVSIVISWKERKCRVHRLIASSFLWLDFNNPLIKVLHKDDNPLNNNLNNLLLWTQAENIRDMILKWRDNFRKRKIIQLSQDLNVIKEWESLWLASRMLWLHIISIYNCCRWKQKTTWWYIWRYKDTI